MIKIVFQYFLYKLFAPHRRGYGVHSPFVFHLVSNVLPVSEDNNLREINAWRKVLSHDKSIILTSSIGAGSKVHPGKGRSIGRMVRRSSLRHKYGRVLYALVQEFKPATIIELGTGIGISTAYLAKAGTDSKIVSIESDQAKMLIASRLHEQFGIRNVSLHNGTFREVFPDVLKNSRHPLLVFIDGDHSFEGTIEYFQEIKKLSDPETIIVFDDIRWSDDMKKAWSTIKKDPATVLSIDMFFMGIIFFRTGMIKQDFMINF